MLISDINFFQKIKKKKTKSMPHQKHLKELPLTKFNHRNLG